MKYSTVGTLYRIFFFRYTNYPFSDAKLSKSNFGIWQKVLVGS